MKRSRVLSQSDWEQTTKAALGGDEAAWRSLVDELSDVVWKVLNNYSLDQMDREEAFASTFFRLYNKLDTVREPDKLPGWVATAARNEANNIWRTRKRVVPTEHLPLRELPTGPVDEALLDSELLTEVMIGFNQLPASGQALLRLITAVPPLSYKEISELLDIPHGSIGPTVGRLLKRLRQHTKSYDSGESL